jgi:hypothetical protein
MKNMGRKIWAIPDGYIPLKSTGREPESGSQDRITILNLNDYAAEIKITIFYQNQDPVNDYSLKVDSRRVKSLRINDLIDPEPVFLNKPYSMLIEADIEIIVQFTKKNSAHRNIAIMGTIGFGTDI